SFCIPCEVTNEDTRQPRNLRRRPGARKIWTAEDCSVRAVFRQLPMAPERFAVANDRQVPSQAQRRTQRVFHADTQTFPSESVGYAVDRIARAAFEREYVPAEVHSVAIEERYSKETKFRPWVVGVIWSGKKCFRRHEA